MTVVDGSRGEYAFLVPRIQAGHWELRFDPVGTSLAVDVPDAGLRELRIEVPPPVEVTVTVEDESGEPVSGMRIHWMPDRTGFESGGVLNQAKLRSPGRFTFTAPEGRVEIWCMSKRWSFRGQIVEIGPGPHALKIEAIHACGVVLTVREAGTQLRVEDFLPVIRLADGDEQAYLSDEDSTGLIQHYVVPGPGLYRVELTPPEGYRTIEPLTLSLAPAEFAEITIDVIRE